MKLSVSGRGDASIPISPPASGKKLPEGRELSPGQKISPGIPGGKGPVLPRAPEQGSGLPLLSDPSFPDSPEVPGPAETALRNLAQALALPRDGLSSSLISFVRYFSLPLEPGMLSRLRAEAASPRFPGRALGAAAAADKGVHLSAEALERYGAAINGEERREGAFSGEGEGQTGQEYPRKEKPPLDPDKLRKKIEAIEADQPLLRLLNGIPGKNGRRWVVLPFSFLSEGVEFRVSVRILLENRGASADTVERLGVDITAGSGGRHWLFVLDRAEKDGMPAGFRAEITLDPPLSQPVSLERELHSLLEPFAAAITLFQGKFTPLRDARDDVLPSVNEEV